MILKRKIFSVTALALMLFFGNILCFSQWKKVTNIPAPYSTSYWLDLYFLQSNPKIGWICGWKGSIIRTTDGGNSWKGTSIAVSGNSNLQLECIRFADEFTGYVSGSDYIFKTTDGGGTWTNVTDPRASGLWGNYFCSPDTGIVVGGGCADNQQFYRTTNGGISWTAFYSTVPNSGLTHVILYSGNGLGYATSSGRLWQTIDGGRSWQVLSVSGNNDWQEQLAHVGSTFILPYSTGCEGNGGVGGIRSSRDNGLTWNDFYTGKSMFGSNLVDANIAWSCGWDKAVYYTSDGGINWELRNCGVVNNDSLDDVWFINDSTGWLVGASVYKYVKAQTSRAEIAVSGPTTFCVGETATLNSVKPFNNYQWSTGETTRNIVVSSAGTYTLRAWNSDCDTIISDAVTVFTYPQPQPSITANKPPVLCEGDSVNLAVQNGFTTYKWSTGDSSSSIQVKTDGIYSVTVWDSNNCKNTTNIYVKVNKNPKPVITVTGNNSPCVGDTLFLSTQPGNSYYYWYLEPGQNPVDSAKTTLKVLASGTYYVKVISPEGCIGISPGVDVNFRNDTNRIEISMSSGSRVVKFDSVRYPGIVCKKVTIRNINWRPYSIENVFVLFNTAFSAPQSQFPIVIQPGDSVELMVCYAPTKLGLEVDTLTIGDICSPHTVPLQGVGNGDKYNGQTDCNAPVTLKTKFLPKKYLFSVFSPMPNPTQGIVKLPFNRFTPENSINSETCVLYNSMGSLTATADVQIAASSKDSDGTSESGDYIFDLNGFGQGCFFIVVKNPETTITYPVIYTK